MKEINVEELAEHLYDEVFSPYVMAQDGCVTPFYCWTRRDAFIAVVQWFLNNFERKGK